jgi:peptidoglycan/xylan/chitin deacetylase (PgdA/CDA1 family)
MNAPMERLSQADRVLRRAAQRRRRRRRRLVTLVGAVVLAGAVVAGVELAGGSAPRRAHAPAGLAAVGRGRRARRRRSAVLPPIAAAHPGPARVVLHGPRTRAVALTFDDGFCARCVAGILRTLARTGAHATIFPNGTYGPTSWDRQAGVVRRLIARGQLAVGNHTFTHRDARTESGAELADDLTRNERWIERTFGATARPFFRPPYGSYDAAVGAVAGQLGYTDVILWSGTLADSTRQTDAYVVHAIKYWARPGAIILAHGNYPATARSLGRLLAVLRARHLRTATLPELLHTR